MSLFRCEECGVVENTALSRFWVRRWLPDQRALCSQCDPVINRWHGMFPRRDADEAGYIKRGDGPFINCRRGAMEAELRAVLERLLASADDEAGWAFMGQQDLRLAHRERTEATKKAIAALAAHRPVREWRVVRAFDQEVVAAATEHRDVAESIYRGVASLGTFALQRREVGPWQDVTDEGEGA